MALQGHGRYSSLQVEYEMKKRGCNQPSFFRVLLLVEAPRF